MKKHEVLDLFKQIDGFVTEAKSDLESLRNNLEKIDTLKDKIPQEAEDIDDDEDDSKPED